jgi:4-diphosphocytidyl-2-C-methyl-D-erythritol kinase
MSKRRKRMIDKLSHAKVNLFLRVLGKRPDGYHELATLMQKIGLCDRISFVKGGKGIQIECPGSSLPVNESNIAYRAAKALFSHVSDNPDVRIIIEKGIPVAAGLGGGSSNAATVLTTLNDLFGYRLKREELIHLGEKLGADVPFFIYGSSAWAFGKGERLEPSEPIPPMWLVLINPGFEVSTKLIYDNLKMGLTNGVLQFNIPKFFSLGDIASGLLNDLERVTLILHPVIKELKDLLIRHGALGALMSGSGPTVFGIYPDKRDAEKAAQAIKAGQNWSVFLTNSLRIQDPSE